MRQISLPLPKIEDAELVEIEVKIGEQDKIVHFRIESFLWETEEELMNVKELTNISFARITRLKSSIESYDKTWELIQIFAPLENSKFIKVLYRKQV